MSGNLLRLGLWVMVAVLALYIAREAMAGSPLARSLSDELLWNAGLGAVGLIALGILVGIGEFIHRKAFRHSFCIVCHRKIRYGDLYCREHLRTEVQQAQDLGRRNVGRTR